MTKLGCNSPAGSYSRASCSSRSRRSVSKSSAAARWSGRPKVKFGELSTAVWDPVHCGCPALLLWAAPSAEAQRQPQQDGDRDFDEQHDQADAATLEPVASRV